MKAKTGVRVLVALGVVLSLGQGVVSGSGHGTARTFPNGVASGDVTTTSVVLWARSSVRGPVSFEIARDPWFRDVRARRWASSSDPLVPVKALVGGLAPGSRHYFRATAANGRSAQGTFVTATPPGRRSGLRFGVSGDWRGELAPYPAVANAKGRGLDFFVLHGDTIYADYPSPALPLPQAETLEDYRLKHAEVYGERFGLNTLADLRAGTSVLATIDDHEVTNDFAGGAPIASDDRFSGDPAALINDSELFENGLSAFQETRSFRDPGLAPANPSSPSDVIRFLVQSFDPRRTLLGRAQTGLSRSAPARFPEIVREGAKSGQQHESERNDEHRPARDQDSLRVAQAGYEPGHRNREGQDGEQGRSGEHPPPRRREAVANASWDTGA